MRQEKGTAAVTVHTEGRKEKCEGQKGENLLAFFQRQGIFLPAGCGGEGKCRKCRVRFLSGASDPVKEEEEVFSRKELSEGWRLACRRRLEKNCEIFIESRQEEARGAQRESCFEKNFPGREQDRLLENLGIAIDLGTTNLVMQLVDLGEGRILSAYQAANRQGIYGGDVISRIKASNEGKREELQSIAREGLLKGIYALTEGHRRKISRISIGANTTMVHLLLGYSCRTLGTHPFRPVNLAPVSTTYRELLEDGGQDAEVWIFPGISAFLGGDLAAGLYALEVWKREKPVMLVDLGTNGEMALAFGGRILGASAAAGPAFESGGAKRGSEALELIWRLKEEGLMDETGRLKEPYFSKGVEVSGGGRYSQRDIRELQLAKAAVRAGMETLLWEAGLGYEEVEEVYLAGAFGCGVDIRKAAGIGLLPGVLAERVSPAGNTCLKGAVKVLLDPRGKEEVLEAAKAVLEVSLWESRKFQEFYMEHMGFEA